MPKSQRTQHEAIPGTCGRGCLALSGKGGTALLRAQKMFSQGTRQRVIVAGRLFGATLTDHFGALGTRVQPVNTIRVTGLALVLAGAAWVKNSKT